MTPATARQLALDVLATAGRGAFAWERLDAALGRAPLPPAERRLATQLVYGVLRRRGSLDALLRPLITRPLPKVEPWLMEALRLGAFQLAYLTHVPAHAALHETVELAAFAGAPRAKGFLNGVLRGLTRLLTDEHVERPAADALPLDVGTFRRLARPVLPDPASKPAEYLAAGWSLPQWLAERWLGRYGWDECARLGAWFAGPAPLWVRVNPLRTDREALRAAFAAAGVESEPGEHPQSLKLAEHVPIRELPGYAEGWFTVQDASATAVGSALAPASGSAVLDLCAAPGGKTTHLAELMQNRGRILACDVDEDRLRTVTMLCQRLGITIVETRLLASREPTPVVARSGDRATAADRRSPLRSGDLRSGPVVGSGDPTTTGVGAPESFDAALVDVPCSNTGVLGRRPEVRWRLTPKDLRHLVPLQTRLLTEAADRLRPGGAVVYSTCSIEPEENAGVVRTVLRERPGLALEAEHESRPGLPADGGYWARLRRR